MSSQVHELEQLYMQQFLHRLQGIATTWSTDKILKVIEVLGDDSIRAQHNGCKDIFAKIASVLLEAGCKKSASQCTDKWKDEYHKVKGNREKEDINYFDVLDAILGHRPATRPPVVINSIGDENADKELDDQDTPHSPELFNDDAPPTSAFSWAMSASPSTNDLQTTLCLKANKDQRSYSFMCNSTCLLVYPSSSISSGPGVQLSN